MLMKHESLRYLFDQTFFRPQMLTGKLWCRCFSLSPDITTYINTRRCPEKPLDFCGGERARQLCASAPLTSTTSMTLLRITIFKKDPSFPSSDKPIIILHLHDKEVCLCTHLCMYVYMYECLNAHYPQSGTSSRLLSQRKRWKKALLMCSPDPCVFALHLSVHH